MHWDVSLVEESSAKVLVLGSMQRERANGSGNDASDRAGLDKTVNGLNVMSQLA